MFARPAKIHARPLLAAHLVLALFLLGACMAQAAPQARQAGAVDLVRVYKAERKLQLVSGGQVVREFKIALGGDPKGPKRQEGDGKTPEGAYTLDYKNAATGYHRAIHISYPNSADRAAARARGVQPGGAIMIHGQKNGYGWLSFASQHMDWTKGCIALSDADMDLVWSLVPAGTRIEIHP